MNPALRLGILNFINIFVWTVNFRAIAQANYVWTAITEFILASIFFFIVKEIADAKTRAEYIAYVMSAVVGAVVAVFVTKMVLGS